MLNPNDYCGFISLGKNSWEDQFNLETKERNTRLKDFFIKQTYKKHELSNQPTDAKNKRQRVARLESALREAIMW